LFCPKCGKELNEGAKFCTDCGKKISYIDENETKKDITQKNSDKKKYIVFSVIVVAFFIIGGIIISNINKNKIENSVVTFKDENFEKTIRDIIDKPKGEDILRKELNGITELQLLDLDDKDKSIEHINGMGNLTSLQTLHIYINEIKDMSELKELKNLQQVYLHDESLSYVAVKSLKDLLPECSIENINKYDKEDVSKIPNYYIAYEKIADVNGDGEKEKIQLVGKKKDGLEHVYEEIKILIKNISTDEVLQSIAPNHLGYIDSLEIYDFNKDGSMDILFKMPSGGSAGDTATEIYSFKDNILSYLYKIDMQSGIMLPDDYINVQCFTDKKEIEFKSEDYNKITKINYSKFIREKTYLDESKGYFRSFYINPINMNSKGESDLKVTSYYTFDYKVAVIAKVETIYTWDSSKQEFVIKDIKFIPDNELVKIVSE
jgi:hypothetical protein